MFSVSVFFLTLSVGFVGLALSVDSGFDWSTDDDDEYESPFADDTDGPEDATDDTIPDDFDWDVDESDDDPDAASEHGPEEDAPSASSSDAEPAPDAPSDENSDSEPDEPTLATAADARALCDEAMDLLHAGETARAFDRLSAHWAFSQDEMTQLQREVERTRAVVADRYGDALDVQLLRDDTAGDVLARFVYLERFELHGLRWRFTFYEGGSGWTLNDVFFDDEIEALLG